MREIEKRANLTGLKLKQRERRTHAETQDRRERRGGEEMKGEKGERRGG